MGTSFVANVFLILALVLFYFKVIRRFRPETKIRSERGDYPEIPRKTSGRENLQGPGEPARNATFGLKQLVSSVIGGGSGLPTFTNRQELADFLVLDMKKMRWLLDQTKVDIYTGISRHYVLKEIPKAKGGTRELYLPKATLKAAQYLILEKILNNVSPHDAAQGFKPGSSVVTNAAPHVGKEVVLTWDLKDFFPTIRFPQVVAAFSRIGYSLEVARDLASLCTTRMKRGHRRRVPQGAPTSPAISNLVAWHLDCRLSGLARKFGYAYTRFADDMTFSGPRQGVKVLLRTVRRIVNGERFRLHPDKFRIHGRGTCQKVTGVVTNVALGTPRSERRRLRAILHQARTAGLEAQNRNKHPHFAAYLAGKIGFVSMVNPDQGRRLKDQFKTILSNPVTP